MPSFTMLSITSSLASLICNLLCSLVWCFSGFEICAVGTLFGTSLVIFISVALLWSKSGFSESVCIVCKCLCRSARFKKGLSQNLHLQESWEWCSTNSCLDRCPLVWKHNGKAVHLWHLNGLLVSCSPEWFSRRFLELKRSPHVVQLFKSKSWCSDWQCCVSEGLLVKIALHCLHENSWFSLKSSLEFSLVSVSGLSSSFLAWHSYKCLMMSYPVSKDWLQLLQVGNLSGLETRSEFSVASDIVVFCWDTGKFDTEVCCNKGSCAWISSVESWLSTKKKFEPVTSGMGCTSFSSKLCGIIVPVSDWGVTRLISSLLLNSSPKCDEARLMMSLVSETYDVSPVYNNSSNLATVVALKSGITTVVTSFASFLLLMTSSRYGQNEARNDVWPSIHPSWHLLEKNKIYFCNTNSEICTSKFQFGFELYCVLYCMENVLIPNAWDKTK